jgi:hypothetical protein
VNLFGCTHGGSSRESRDASASGQPDFMAEMMGTPRQQGPQHQAGRADLVESRGLPAADSESAGSGVPAADESAGSGGPAADSAGSGLPAADSAGSGAGGGKRGRDEDGHMSAPPTPSKGAKKDAQSTPSKNTST